VAYTFTKLTKAQRKEIAEAQVEQFERELFGHQLNRVRLLAAGEVPDSESVKEADRAMVMVEKAIAATATEAGKLKPDSPGGGGR
jgi:signal-transduction protein with cAMP-binding, CBS, and nucleotidyltransferase domain